MAHGIEMVLVDDEERYAFAFAGKPAWHALGQRIGAQSDFSIALREVEQAALADWHVITDAVLTAADSAPLDGVRALLRDRDRKVLGVATDRYAVVQHRELGALLQLLVDNKKASWETCGVLNEGRRVFYAVRLTQKIEAVRGDETEMFVTATTSHDGTALAQVLLTSERVVCQNTLNAALGADDSYVIRHRGGAADALTRIRDDILAVEGRVARVNEGFKDLARIVLSERQAQRFLDTVVPVPALPPPAAFSGMSTEKQERLLYTQDRALRVQARIRELHEVGAGADLPGVVGSAWGWLNACTNFASHEMRSKSKIESTMVGEAAKLGRRAYAALTETNLRHEILDVAA